MCGEMKTSLGRTLTFLCAQLGQAVLISTILPSLFTPIKIN